MTCPHCKSRKSDSRVIDSRIRGGKRQRRHECTLCSERWTTVEDIPDSDGRALHEMLKRVRNAQIELSREYHSLEALLRQSRYKI